jgi:hypothetical protein
MQQWLSIIKEPECVHSPHINVADASPKKLRIYSRYILQDGGVWAAYATKLTASDDVEMYTSE